MEENNSEQNIDPTSTSTSQIDQITKVPTDSKPKPKSKAKIAAGKKLAEYNRRAKEKQKVVQENDEEPVENEESSSFFPATSLTSIIALLGLGLTALDLFLRYKGQQNNSKNEVEDDKNQEPDEKEYEDVTKMKVIDSKSFGGME